MPDANFDDVYDPLATPNPAYDDDFEPTSGRISSWERRGLAQVLLARARARQDAIADAFVDSLIGGKISLFRLLIDLEQAAVTGEAEAQEARLPTLAELLIPMLDRERKQAAENAAAAAEVASVVAAIPAQGPAQTAAVLDPPALALAPSSEAASESQIPEPQTAAPQAGVTNLQAVAAPATEAAAKSRPCRSRSWARHQRRSSGENNAKTVASLRETAPSIPIFSDSICGNANRLDAAHLAHTKGKIMKKQIRTAVMCSLIVLGGLVAVVPANASIGGSNPRPTTPPTSSPSSLSILLSALGL